MLISDEDEEFDKDEEDKEVARIFNQSKDMQRRLLKGTNTCTLY